MSYRYIALIDTNRRWDFANLPEVEALLRAEGMQAPFTIGPIKLFVSQETPWLQLPGGAIVIGHIFSKLSPGNTVNERLSVLPEGSHLRRELMHKFWGEYLLVQPGDTDSGEAVITRDPSGGVPCIYSLNNGVGFVTSDLSLAIGSQLYKKRIEWSFISHCLTYPNLKTRSTAFSDVLELLPGMSLTIRPKSLTTDISWSPWTFVAQDHRHTDLAEAAVDIRSTVETAIHAWATIDSSILMELSGGLDSSIVAACLSAARPDSLPPVTCYNLTTPVPGADERLYATAMASHLGMPLEIEQLDPNIAIRDLVPLPGSVSPRMGVLQYAVSHAMEKAAQQYGASSAYMGSGGDTVFGLLTNAVPAADAVRERGLVAGLSSVRDLSVLHQCTMWKAARLTAKKLLRPPKAPCESDQTFLHPHHTIQSPETHPWFDAPAGAFPGDRERIFDLASNQLFRDIVYRGDQCAIRMPLLSQPVMETCLRVPTWMSIAAGHNRAAARAAFSDALPSSILSRRSKGSFVGYLGAIFKRNRDQMQGLLLTGALHDARLLDADALTRFFNAQLPARDTAFTRVMYLFAVENWLRHQT